ncbi:hypothetical protein [Luteibacter aegosomatissinici]|uniref:hypothetical protein n=1 Tax=Luteibacter aegosomatissinici TaxID=2911539 RepID=UPI001FFA231B|nr:hypothetical protein [Luteibacter aegosomatissinici]UPG92635.1 hypothetical protein L2Y97_12225 [Luteibacter aegosomatissinici]
MTTSINHMGSNVDTPFIDAATRTEVQTSSSGPSTSTRPPDDIGLHARLTRLEDGSFYVRHDIEDIRNDVREIKRRVTSLERAIDKIGSDLSALKIRFDDKVLTLNARIDDRFAVLNAKIDNRFAVLEARLAASRPSGHTR